MIPTFLLSLAGGMMVVLAMVQLSEISWKFLRLCGFLLLGLLTIATTLIFLGVGFGGNSVRLIISASGVVGASNAAVLAIISPLAARLPLLTRAVCALGGAFALYASIGSLQYTQAGHSPIAQAFTLACVGHLTSAFLLGTITVAWLLGHAYLTATKMTIVPLRRFSRILSGAVVIRGLFVVVSIGLAMTAHPSPDIFARLGNAWMIVLLRGGVGLLLVGLCAYMVADCVRLRATQSATGILYFGSLGAYVGELAAQHLTRELAWPM